MCSSDLRALGQLEIPKNEMELEGKSTDSSSLKRQNVFVFLLNLGANFVPGLNSFRVLILRIIHVLVFSPVIEKGLFD